MIPPRLGYAGHKNRVPVATKYPAILDLITLQDAAGMSDARLTYLAGYERAILRRLRKGHDCNTQTLSNLAEVFGYELRLTPKEPKDGNEKI